MNNGYYVGKTVLKAGVPAVVVIGVAKAIEIISDGKINGDTSYYLSTGIFSVIAAVTNFIKNFWRRK